MNEVVGPLVAKSVPGQVTVNRVDLSSSRITEGAALAAALQQLVNDGVLVQWPPKDPSYTTDGHDMLMLTAWGERMQAAGSKAKSMALARRRIGVDLHPALAGKLRDLISVGAFESAALNALRAVEARVRKLAGDPRSTKGSKLTGVPLMKTAFGVGGPLADSATDPGEQVGVMDLYSGAFGAIRNVLAHTDEVEWTDSVEAAEYVLLADLLMRRLDKTEARLKAETKAKAIAAVLTAATNLGKQTPPSA